MKNSFRSIFLPLLTAAIWGTAFVAQDVCAGNVPPVTFNAIRFALAVVFLLLVKGVISAFKKGRKSVEAGGGQAVGALRNGAGEAWRTERLSGMRTLLIAGALCGFALAVASNLQQAGMEAGTDSGKAGFITALYVVLVPIGELLLKKRFPKVFWAGLALALVGLYLLCISGSFTLAPGDLLLLLCAAAFAVQILLIDRFAGSLDPISFCIAEFAFAAVFSAALALFIERPDWAKVLEYALPILYVAIFSCGIAYLLQIVAQREGDPAIVSLLFSMESVFSVIGGAIILSQRMTAREYAGCALILLAVIIAQLPEGRGRRKAKSER
ncbi:MAG: DMT family transporter [Clostridia bacterium]|nr:DMT family transporter [Clostridia bacterium]